jgi:hypothetical protein
LISFHNVTSDAPTSDLRALPLKVSKSYLPQGVLPGDFIDVYALANIAGQINSSHPTPLKALTHVKLLNIDDPNTSYGSDVGITVETKEQNIQNALAQVNGSMIVVVKDGE